MIWVRHVVILGGACQTVGSSAILLGPANGRINRHMHYVDALRHQFSGHTLRQSCLGMTGHSKGAASCITLKRGAGIGKQDGSALTLCIGF